MNRNRNLDDNRLNANFNSNGSNRNGYVVSIALATKTSNSMKSYNHLYGKIISYKNFVLAWKKARKGKTNKEYVIEFEKNLKSNLLGLRYELKNKIYKPRELVNFILRDPKTRKISKSDFRDRVVHHAIVNILEPIFEKIFIYDSSANRKGKGNLFALERFEHFMNKVSKNGKPNGWYNENQIRGYCLKADIKHYFQEVNREILLSIIRKKITDEEVAWLIKQILNNNPADSGGGANAKKVCLLAT